MFLPKIQSTKLEMEKVVARDAEVIWWEKPLAHFELQNLAASTRQPGVLSKPQSLHIKPAQRDTIPPKILSKA